MKRLLLALLLAAALLGLLAAPAIASAPWAADDFRLSANTAYIFSYNDGSWFEVTDVDAGTFVGHWVAYDEGNFVAPADPIPADYDVVMQVSVKTNNYGLVKTLPLALQIQLSIPDLGVEVSYEQSGAYWSGPHLWDEYWVNGVMPIDPFNPHLGTRVYANTWLVPLTGESGLAANLIDGNLPVGTYTVYYTERGLRTWTGLDLIFDGQKTPYHSKPYMWEVAPYTFTVE